MSYEKVSTDTGTDYAVEDEPFLSETQSRRYQQPRRWPWILGTVLSSTLSCVLLLQTLYLRGKDTTCPAWRESDFPAAREAIEYVDVTFQGNSAFDENGHFYIPNPVEIDYVGAGPLVDEAWANLTGERDFLISEDEAKQLWGNDYQIHWHHRLQGYEIGLDMFHTLHCIDRLRQLYYPDVYPLPEDPRLLENTHKHRGHCINQIRQYVMCAGDMSPYGTRYYENPGRNYADSDVTHTCRNFDKLREWTRNRYHQGGALHRVEAEVWDHWHKEPHHWE